MTEQKAGTLRPYRDQLADAAAFQLDRTLALVLGPLASASLESKSDEFVRLKVTETYVTRRHRPQHPPQHARSALGRRAPDRLTGSCF